MSRPDCYGLWERSLQCAACPHKIDCVGRTHANSKKAPDQALTGERDDTICCQCGEDVPESQAMDSPRDPDAWVHIDCPAWTRRA